MSSKNTLFSYFKKVDKVAPVSAEKSNGFEKSGDVKNDENKPKNTVKVQSKKSEKPETSPESAKKKRKLETSNGNKKEGKTPQRAPGKKFKRIVQSDSSEDEEAGNKKKKLSEGKEKDWKPESEESESEEEEVSEDSEFSGEDEIDSENEEVAKPKKNSSSAKKPAKAAVKKSLNNSVSSKADDKELSKSIIAEKVWTHMKLEFLKPEKIRDGNKRRPGEADYNPHTVYVPPEFIKTLTPAMRQWWDIKSRHYDCVIFIKLGKFYELYHMDAAIGVNELNLIYMNHPETAHAGFPEAAFARYSSALVERNYKVARVEQTETPDMMAERCKKMRAPTKFDKVVNREVCQITSKGTRLYLAIEGDASTEDHSYLIAVTEGKSSNNNPVFGVCFVDTSIGDFHVGQFEDDRHKSQLRMLIAHYPPVQVLLDKGRVTDDTKNIFECVSNTAIIEFLAHETEFLSASDCLTRLHENKYFKCDDEGKSEWPPVLAELTSFKDLRTPEPEKEMALSALGGCLWYLIDCKIDLQLVCINNFTSYQPELQDGALSEKKAAKKMTGTMVLDSTTLQNLDVMANGESGEREGSLLARLDHCCTPFGKRLLRQWLCSPLCSIDAIKMRQQAVSALMKMTSECDEARKILKELPDLERLLMKISVYGNALTAAKHPESRAIFYQDFSQKKIGSFLSLLKGFEKSLSLLDIFSMDEGEMPELLKRLTRTKDADEHGRFPDFKEILDFFKEAFDPDDALKSGKITPRKGVDDEFEECCKKLKDVDDELMDHLREVKNKLRCEAKYIGTDKKRFQIEVPEKVTVPSSFELSGSRKGFKRYYSPESKELLVKYQAAEVEKRDHLLDINRKMFARFAKNADLWKTATECLAIIDVLLSLAQYGLKEDTCMPVFEESSDDKHPFVEIKEGRLPTTNLTDFIPNDTVAGVDGVRLLLLTGPNMGGKSTLMRQFGLIVIMAQIGCPVPAEECRLTPVDRIFTRIGARDHILAGESTFFVEMSETSAILKHATNKSIVLVDELGRGTTTFDGAAIASAVLENLVSNNCLTIFSTHYHFLVDKYATEANVSLVHMACMEEDDDDDDDKKEAKVENVTLLYKLSPGACPSSYGFNAARLAGLPDTLVLKAKQQAQKLQNHPKKVKMFADLMHIKQGGKDDLAKIIEVLKKGLHLK